MITQRKDLQVGVWYYIDGRKITRGMFVEKDIDSIYFYCGVDHPYHHSALPSKNHLVAFNLEGQGFEEVE
jgi:hypothetical protein